MPAAENHVQHEVLPLDITASELTTYNASTSTRNSHRFAGWDVSGKQHAGQKGGRELPANEPVWLRRRRNQ